MSENKAKSATKSDNYIIESQLRKKRLAEFYRNEEKVPMMLSPMYRPYFGNVMRVMINGISIFFPVDGTTHQIPKTFADEIASRRKQVDALIVKQNRMADITKNAETNPGELNLF